jgi:hypothetical protein
MEQEQIDVIGAGRASWLQFSLDRRLVYADDGGHVIDARTHGPSPSYLRCTTRGTNPNSTETVAAPSATSTRRSIGYP